MTGSGMPQRFAQLDGTMVDVYQAPTQMTDESGQTYPFTPNTLLDKALGSEAYYGYFVANMHTDQPSTQQDTALLSSAVAHGVPIVAARDVLRFIDGRNASSFQTPTWNSGTLSFGISVGTGATNLTSMVPTAGPGGTVLNAVKRGATTVTYQLMTIKGIQYAMFPAVAGSYTATYGAPGGAPQVQSLSTSVADDGTATVSFATDLPSTSKIIFGETPTQLSSNVEENGSAGEHELTLTDLQPAETYFYRVVTAGRDGSQDVWPPRRRAGGAPRGAGGRHRRPRASKACHSRLAPTARSS